MRAADVPGFVGFGRGREVTDISKLDGFTRGYIESALWSSTDTSDDGVTVHLDESDADLAPQTLAAMVADCDRFRAENDIDAACAAAECNDEQAGHDFWLTRAGHGAGFWDGDWPEPYASELDKASKAFGLFELYIGDDGLIYAGGYERYPEMPS